jgi:hypothetical protein
MRSTFNSTFLLQNLLQIPRKSPKKCVVMKTTTLWLQLPWKHPSIKFLGFCWFFSMLSQVFIKPSYLASKLKMILVMITLSSKALFRSFNLQLIDFILVRKSLTSWPLDILHSKNSCYKWWMFFMDFCSCNKISLC